MDKYWGIELIVNLSSCDKDKIIDEENIKNFIKSLVKKIKMESWGEPLLQHFATHDEEKAGYSFCQMITTSAITGHLVDLNGNAFINIFSCKEFDASDAVDVIKEFFNPQKISVEFIERWAPK